MAEPQPSELPPPPALDEMIQQAQGRGYRPIYLKDGALADFQAQVHRFIVALDETVGGAAKAQVAIAKTKADEMIYWLNRAKE